MRPLRDYTLARLVACALLGALMGCATPPMDVYPLAWVGMVAFAWMLAEEDQRVSDASLLRRAVRFGSFGLAFGVGTNLVALRFAQAVVTRFTDLPWVVGPLALVGLAAFEASRWLVAGVAYAVFIRLRVARSLSFAFGVYAGTLVPTLLSWTVAVGACSWPITVQLAELIGERGVAMLMALEAALVMEWFSQMVRKERALGWRSLGLAAALVVASLAYGAVRMAQVDALRAASPRARVALVAPSVPSARDVEHAALAPDVAQDTLRRLTELTRQAERDGADLVVWPEAAHPFPMLHVSRHAPEGDQAIVQPGVRGPILTGLVMMGEYGKYNSAVLATSDGMVSEPYDKIHLMWFGEYVPLSDVWPWLRQVFGRGLGFKAGERTVLMKTGSVKAAVLICLEDILAGAGREATRARPNLLVNVTNDAWFEGSAESELHLRLAVLRAIETRRDMVRAVNLGPTTWVDAVGRIAARQPPAPPGVLMTEPALIDSPPPFYAEWGDLPLVLLVGVYVVTTAVKNARL